ncbi:unnamed protein product [Timema podura]|uniref:Uncharacterized protein n=1 Tax=Timema podura TaxID=61482 RepID=A0ABN7NRK3_TIMPD|nr:unnamed protein product [Timema podura]
MKLAGSRLAVMWRNKIRNGVIRARVEVQEDSSSLAQNEVDLSWYYCQLLPHATKARLQHKQELCNISKPWWKKLQHDET